MIMERWTKIVIALFAAALVCGCEMLHEKPKDDQKINRMMDDIENGEGR